MSKQNDQPNSVLPVTPSAFNSQKPINTMVRARHDRGWARYVLVFGYFVCAAVFEVSRMSKARNCFLHDSQARYDRKMMRLIQNCGMEGYGVVWWLIEEMRGQADLKIDAVDFEIYARQMGIKIDLLWKVVELAEIEGLFISEEGRYTAPALARDIAKLKEKQDKWRGIKQHQRMSTEDKERTEKSVHASEGVESIERRNKSTELRTQKIDPRKKRKEAEPKSRDELEALGKVPLGESGDVWLTPAEHERLKLKFGETFAARCIEKLDAWISQKRTPDRVTNGQNGAATLRSWVINAVTEEQAKAEKIQGGYQSKMAAKMARIDQL